MHAAPDLAIFPSMVLSLASGAKGSPRQAGPPTQYSEMRRAAKTHSHQAKECKAQRSADSGRGSNDALGQIEVTAATREIGDDQRREHPDHRPTDAIEQLKANEKRRICGQGKQRHRSSSQQ